MIGKVSNEFVKVPEGMLKKANLSGTSTLLEFWYLLKSKENSGHFITLQEIQQQTTETFSSIYKKITKLVNLKWIIKDSTGYKLISYDKLFLLFNYNMQLKRCKKGYRAGTFKIFKIKIQNFKNNIIKEELQLNFRRQRYVIAKKILTQKKEKMDSSNRVTICKEVTLSVRGVSRILGYKSASKGYKIERELENQGLIKVVRRPILYNYSLRNLLLF